MRVARALNYPRRLAGELTGNIHFVLAAGFQGDGQDSHLLSYATCVGLKDLQVEEYTVDNSVSQEPLCAGRPGPAPRQQLSLTSRVTMLEMRYLPQ